MTTIEFHNVNNENLFPLATSPTTENVEDEEDPWLYSRFDTNARSYDEDDEDNMGVNKILPGWDNLFGYWSEETALKKLKLDVSRKPSILRETGVFGETILHWALLMHSRLAAKWLIENHKWLRDETYASEDKTGKKKIERFKGEGCLHIIIANRDFDMALYLLKSYDIDESKTFDMGDFETGVLEDNGYPLNKQRAVGSFFKETGDNTVYYGETALDFAVATNQINMVDLLMGYPEQTINGKGKFNRKWRASMRFRDSFHQNSVFHLCALKGHTEMWHILIGHFEDTVASLSNLDRRENEVELEVQRRVGSMLNAYGLTPMQVAAYKNDKKMVEVILNQTRLQIWKWGEEAFYAYPLNEIDEYFKSSKETPGIPVNTIILCEGNSELVGTTVIGKLMKEKWHKFGRTWALVYFLNQLFFCILLTCLFSNTYPHLENLELRWGVITNFWEGIVYFLVFAKVVCQMIRSIVEMGTIVLDDFALQKEILTQKAIAQELRSHPSIELSNSQKVKIDRKIRTELKSVAAKLKSFRKMWSVYFENDLAIPLEFQNMQCKRRAHGSVTGFFNMISWVSNICFCVAQGAALIRGKMSARALLISMIFIMICEYVLLFLWLQAHRKIGRFLLSVVIILETDIFGFVVVFMIVQLVFTICFLFLSDEGDIIHNWSRAFFLWFELSVGSGEWFKEKLDTIEEYGEVDFIDPYRRALLYFTYLLYISITLVIFMNLLIAIMSETAFTLTKQMELLGNLKLSSVSLISRRFRAWSSISHFFRSRTFCSSETSQTVAIGGRTEESTKIIFGRLKINKVKSSTVRNCTNFFEPVQYYKKEVSLYDYFSQMRYWTVVEHEALNIDKNGVVMTKDDHVIEDACMVVNEKMKEFFSGYQIDRKKMKCVGNPI